MGIPEQPTPMFNIQSGTIGDEPSNKASQRNISPQNRDMNMVSSKFLFTQRLPDPGIDKRYNDLVTAMKRCQARVDDLERSAGSNSDLVEEMKALVNEPKKMHTMLQASTTV
jgi:hypothetical protein